MRFSKVTSLLLHKFLEAKANVVHSYVPWCNNHPLGIPSTCQSSWAWVWKPPTERWKKTEVSISGSVFLTIRKAMTLIFRTQYWSVHVIKTPTPFSCLPLASGTTRWLQSRLPAIFANCFCKLQFIILLIKEDNRKDNCDLNEFSYPQTPGENRDSF